MVPHSQKGSRLGNPHLSNLYNYIAMFKDSLLSVDYMIPSRMQVGIDWNHVPSGWQ